MKTKKLLVAVAVLAVALAGCMGNTQPSGDRTSSSELQSNATVDDALRLLNESVSNVEDAPVLFVFGKDVSVDELEEDMIQARDKAQRAREIAETLEDGGKIETEKASRLKATADVIIGVAEGDIAHARAHKYLENARSHLRQASTNNIKPLNRALEDVETARQKLNKSQSIYAETNASLAQLDDPTVNITPVRNHLIYQHEEHMPFMRPLGNGWVSYVEGLRSLYTGLGTVSVYLEDGRLPEERWRDASESFEAAKENFNQSLRSFDEYMEIKPARGKGSIQRGQAEAFISSLRTLRQTATEFRRAADAGAEGNTNLADKRIQEARRLLGEVSG
ncbi:MAG: hypothetical protein SV253_06295 [Halobacteria archaeon]|nr:hypothetical protein [Halobacteria archaeon]